jgi:hypothetical protein
MNTRHCATAMLLIWALCLVTFLPSAAFANHQWGNYHWARTANPFTVKIGDNVTSVWDPILATTSSDWSASSVLNTTIVAGNGTKPRRCNPTAGRVEVCNTTYGNNGWLGIASIWANGDHITQGTVKLNDTYFNTSTYNTTAWRNLVSCQEVGHTFGLDHQDEVFDNPNLGTCMDYTNNPGTNQHPNAHDYDELVTIYTHLDSTTTVGFTLDALYPDVDTNNPNEWGNAIRVTRNGHVIQFERDLGYGQRLFTFVYYAEPRGNHVD